MHKITRAKTQKRLNLLAKQIPESSDEGYTNATSRDQGNEEDGTLKDVKGALLANHIGDLLEEPSDEYLEPSLQVQVEDEIKSMFSSFFRVQTFPPQIISYARSALQSQVAKLTSLAVHKQVLKKRKAQNLPVYDILQVINQFGDHYRNKIAKTFIVDSQTKNEPKIGRQEMID